MIIRQKKAEKKLMTQHEKSKQTESSWTKNYASYDKQQKMPHN